MGAGNASVLWSSASCLTAGELLWTEISTCDQIKPITPFSRTEMNVVTYIYISKILYISGPHRKITGTTCLYHVVLVLLVSGHFSGPSPGRRGRGEVGTVR